MYVGIDAAVSRKTDRIRRNINASHFSIAFQFFGEKTGAASGVYRVSFKSSENRTYAINLAMNVREAANPSAAVLDPCC